ncbi:MAG: tRNA (adenosine(37)-N6)-threonylcarbamoyltransferase complex transferase subunit TsaD [Terracidiphilus sp.]|jgi:N6-L-threonylcarbamoyladenine synthase
MPGSGLILGIESSCDETAAAIVERGARTVSSVVASQIATHARYGGVVPELASREHLRAIVPVVRAALAEAHLTLADLDAIAVTSGPGLAGALLVGITYAKALAFANHLPLIAVNHLEGHIHAVLLNEREERRAKSATEEAVSPRAKDAGGFATQKSNRRSFDSSAAGGLALDDNRDPENDAALALVVSGGHTHLYLAHPAQGTWNYTLVGRTVDDAAGEAFDKVAKLLGLGYPGGPWIDALAKFGNPHAVPFSFAQIKTKVHLAGKPPRTKAAKTSPIARLDPHFLFSFSGIKTAVLRYVELHGLRAEARARVSRVLNNFRPPQTREEALALCPQPTLDLIASVQHAVIGDLMKKTFAAAESLGTRRILVTGGVAANRELRERFTREAAARGVRIAFPTLALSTDNAAMIAAAAWPRLLAEDFAPPELSADPSLTLR